MLPLPEIFNPLIIFFIPPQELQLVSHFQNNKAGSMRLEKTVLTEQEINFLKMASSDLTYKEVAHRMHLSVRSIDTIRDHLFLKLDVKSRVGLAMIAIRNGIVTL